MGWIEDAIADLLSQTLDQYVDGFSSTDIEFSAWQTLRDGGLAKLEFGPLKLKADALTQFLPVKIISGCTL